MGYFENFIKTKGCDVLKNIELKQEIEKSFSERLINLIKEAIDETVKEVGVDEYDGTTLDFINEFQIKLKERGLVRK